MSGNHLTMLRASIIQNPLHQVIPILVASNVDQRNPGSIATAFANSVKITAQEIGSANLETLLYNLGSELIHAIFGHITYHMIDGSAPIRWSAMLADMLNAPVPKLTVCHNVDVGKDFFYSRALKSP
jgi:hypothetical protein